MPLTPFGVQRLREVYYSAPPPIGEDEGSGSDGKGKGKGKRKGGLMGRDGNVYSSAICQIIHRSKLSFPPPKVKAKQKSKNTKSDYIRLMKRAKKDWKGACESACGQKLSGPENLTRRPFDYQ